MSKHSVVHSTFTVERTYPASAARVFAAFANQATKRRWFAQGEGWEVQEFALDFRVGGRESARFRFKGSAPAPVAGKEIRNDTVYQDIVPDHRIVFAYTMTIGEQRISASLGTVEIVPAADGSKLTYTEQGAFFDGSDGSDERGKGWRALLEQLDKELRT
jgi:uncharacterized protein YndB with AHSA1/START domain